MKQWTGIFADLSHHCLYFPGIEQPEPPKTLPFPNTTIPRIDREYLRFIIWLDWIWGSSWRPSWLCSCNLCPLFCPLFLSEQSKCSHHIHASFLHQRVRMLHRHLPRSHHPRCFTPPQHEESGDGWQVCMYACIFVFRPPRPSACQYSLGRIWFYKGHLLSLFNFLSVWFYSDFFSNSEKMLVCLKETGETKSFLLLISYKSNE